jgi:predicted RNase H-like HicB family nuclease
MENRVLLVRAMWDNEAGVWVAESDDVPGLVTEAETQSALIAKLSVLIPELLELNQVSIDPNRPVQVALQYHGEERFILPTAA